MSKEELIRLMESIDFELVTNLTMTYYKEKPINFYVNDDDKYKPKTITFNKDFEKIINEDYRVTQNRIEDIYGMINDLESRVKEIE